MAIVDKTTPKARKVEAAARQSFRSSQWFLQLTVGMAVFTDIFLYGLIVPVMPFALQSRTDVKEDEIQSWVSILIAVYGGALAFVSPICGWAADRSSSRRWPMILGLLALAGATVLLQLGTTIALLIFARILQGISAAVVWVVGLALLADTIPKAELGQAMGLVFLAMSLGILFGPLFGGLVFERAGYNAVFAMAYGFIALDVILRFLMMEKPRLVLPMQVVTDTSGSTSAQASQQHEMVFRKDIEVQTTEADTHAQKRAIVELRALSKDTQHVSDEVPKRQVPVMATLLNSLRLLTCLWGVMTTALLGAQFDSVLPFHVQKTFNWTSTNAGLVFLPITLTAFLSPIVGWGVDRYGPRWFITAGFFTLAIFEAALSTVTSDTIGDKVTLCVLLGLIGISFDFTITPLLVTITEVVEAMEVANPGGLGPRGAMAQAYGLFNFAWALGSLVGPLWAGFVNSRAGWVIMVWSLAALSIVTAIPMAVWPDGLLFARGRFRRQRK